MSDFIISAFSDEAAESLEDQIIALKRNGLKHIEIRNVDGKCIIDFSNEELDKINGILSDNGITVSAIASPIGKSDINKPFEEELKRYEKTINAAVRLHTTRIRMFSFFIPKGDDPARYKEEVIKRLKVFTDMANEAGVACYHENEKEIYGDIKERVVEIHTANKDLKGIFDPANYIQCNQNPIEIVDEVKKYVDYIHVKDAFFEDGSVAPIGFGDGNFDKIVDIFYKENSDMLLTVEPHLSLFSGLSNLQDEELKHRFTYGSQGEAFDTAVASLKIILDRKGYKYE